MSVTIDFVGNGKGLVTAGSPAIRCEGTCMVNLPPGARVTLRAEAAAGSTFLAWMGACSGGGDCTFSAGG